MVCGLFCDAIGNARLHSVESCVITDVLKGTDRGLIQALSLNLLECFEKKREKSLSIVNYATEIRSRNFPNGSVDLFAEPPRSIRLRSVVFSVRSTF
jgi:hypothetical protein